MIQFSRHTIEIQPFFNTKMASRVSIFFLFLAPIASAFHESNQRDFVLTLDHTNFTNTVIKHDFIVVQFYSPRCGHCKILASEYEKAASVLSSHHPPIVLAKFDTEDKANKDIAAKYRVKVIPALKIFRNGGKSIQDYTDPSEAADGIVDFLKKQSSPASAEAMLFVNFTNEAADSFESKYLEAAEQYKGRDILFSIRDVDANHDDFQLFGLREEQLPLLVLQTSDGMKYLKPNLDPDDIAPWLEDYKDGKVSPYIKSEPVPETNDEPVKVVVADTLQDLVFNSGKNVLIAIYAPWSAHCRRMCLILDEVAASFEKDDSVLIAKLDGTANDVPRETFEVRGYPALFFQSAKGKLVEYNGERTKEDMIEFVMKNKDGAGFSQSEEKAGEDEL